MSPLSTFVQAPDEVVFRRVWFLFQEKRGEGPDGVKLGFAIHEMFEIGGKFQVRDDGAERVAREIPDGHDMGGVSGTLDRCIVSF
jgi:hypothetical protein